MPELIEQMYCSQQIVIPPKFPYLLKRYCKAAIKTQPYDLLRWSYEYFTALAEHRPPPVKLRLEYPVYSTEGGLTRGCLKVLANQLAEMPSVPLVKVRQAWQGFCLDPHELHKILCLCEVFMREDTVPFLHFIAVAGGLLTKTLTHTMILLCETLTHEPDGGSAAIPVQDFLVMYRFLAAMDASKDVKYLNGYREGVTPQPDSTIEEEEHQISSNQTDEETISDEYWSDSKNLHKVSLINDHVPKTARLSIKLNMPVFEKIERSPSIERAGQIERENYMRERKGRATTSEEVEEKLREMSAPIVRQETKQDTRQNEETIEKKEGVEIIVVDEDGNAIPYEIHGEPKELEIINETGEETNIFGDKESNSAEIYNEEHITIEEFVKECYESRQNRIEDLELTFELIAVIVNRFKSANYDLGMVAGRQMSTTSGEFVVAHVVEQDIMDCINEQIDILPDPALKKKKAKPEEVAMVRDILEQLLDENMDIIAPEIEEVEEEEHSIPEVTVVHAVPGIGPTVDEDIIVELEQFLLESSGVQADVIMPRNLRHFMCPPLEKFEEHNYENMPKKEEVATGGIITD